MNRKQFLRGSGWAVFGALTMSKKIPKPTEPDCVLIPRETAGPFPLDLTENDAFFRQDVREFEAGVPLRLKMKILGTGNCEPMQNVRVNIWHCDRKGIYSGYNSGNNPGDPEGTQLRGYQFTDANGEVEFLTVFPGWYPGRICHIHFQVSVSSAYAAVSQLTFPLDIRNTIYADHPDLYPKGADPLDLDSDGIFADKHELQLATLAYNTEMDEYESYLEVTVEDSGTTGIGYIERQIDQIFSLDQNAPNPYLVATHIPFELKMPAHVGLTLWNMNGQKLATIFDQELPVGRFSPKVHPTSLGLAAANYVYQLEAQTNKGVFRLPKVMTAKV